MKHVRSLQSEPPLLAKYRAEFPQEDQRPASEASAAWEQFKSHQAAYSELLSLLADAQQGLCIYCEQRLVDGTGQLVFGDYQVEHVKAKSGAVGRALDWHNLALACGGGTYRHHADNTRFQPGANQSCGQTKDDADLPHGCDPRALPLLDALIDVGINGRLVVNANNCAAAGVLVADMSNAIALLNLDCDRLRSARQAIGDNVRNWLVPILQQLVTGQHTAAQRAAFADLMFAGRLQPDALGGLPRFWTTERCALGPSAENWIAKNQGLFT